MTTFANPLTSPPGTPNTAYTLASFSGEIIYIPCSKSATRLLVTGKETENAFAVVGSGGSPSAPIGFHYHREAHDVFLCLKGAVNVWAGEKARRMEAGDFASVPPGVIHQYQIVGEYTEFVGLIVPGGWEEFFRFIGEPYAGPLWPVHDDRNPFEVLIPKLKMAAERFDMVPQPMHKGFDPQAWEEGDSVLPGACEPYFLKALTGPRYVVDEVLVRPLAMAKESNGRFEIGCVEGSSMHGNELKDLKFGVHHAFHVESGTLELTTGGDTSRLAVGETAYIPKEQDFSLKFGSRFARAYVFSSGAGLVEKLVNGAGEEYKDNIVPEKSNVSSVNESTNGVH